MKSLYIISFLVVSIGVYAQQEKVVSEIQEAPNYKESKELEAKMMKEAQEKALQKTTPVTLASEQGLEVKKQPTKQEIENSSGKLLPNTASLDEILATIPGRQARKANIPKNANKNVQGLVSSPDLTLEDIKKTIPKN
ncbi:hypothetical protein [Chryseobacterium taiwanense]|uniref:Uncharacterized protein n=1 Tax=Chryseobacterium taiwanense TaxID=363331 RepID=A0A0B4CKD9_9FLAO|nr:hypothetical protein [Chryseobacterium taiwanense]KIC61719.1 hypothetical protein RM51_15065 [Chryseobacterium taiwanense]